MGLHSTFFGPVKYSALPELMPEEKLTTGNAYVEVGLVPFGSLGMTVLLVDLGLVLSTWPRPATQVGTAELMASAGAYRLLFDLFGIAIFGGIFTVLLYTLVQQRSNREHRSRIIGANNSMNALFMVIGSGLLMWFLQVKIALPIILLIYAAFNLSISIYIYSLVPVHIKIPRLDATIAMKLKLNFCPRVS